MAWSPDSQWLAAGGYDGEALVYHVRPDRADLLFSVAGATTVTGVVGLSFSPDGSRLLSGDEGISAATIWDVSPRGDAEVANMPGNPGEASGAVYAPDGRLATTTGNGTVTLWNTVDPGAGVRLEPADTALDNVRALAISPDGSTIAAGGSEDAARVWETASGREVLKKPTSTWVSKPAFSPNGSLVALAEDNGVLTLRDQDGAVVAQLQADNGFALLDPAFSPDGTVVAVGHFPIERTVPDAYRLLLWDWQSDTTTSWPDVAGRAFYSPDGHQMVVEPGFGRPPEVRATTSGDLLFGLEGHDAPTTDIAYSPDGSQIATGSEDGTVRLWDATTGITLLRLPEVAGGVSQVAFSPNGRRLAAGTFTGLVRVWALDTEELLELAADNVQRDLTESECQEYLHGLNCSQARD